MNIHEKAPYKDFGDHSGIFDGGDDLQGAAAVGTVFNIDIEHPFEQLGESLRRAGVAGGARQREPLQR